MLVARDDPLDTYLVTHPEALLGPPVEATVFDPDNPYVLGPHLCAAAHELPLHRGRPGRCSGRTARDGVDELDRGRAAAPAGPRGWFWTDRRRASDLADIRSAGGSPVQLVEAGDRPAWSAPSTPSGAHSTAHAGAVYLHQGETYLVESLDLDEHVAVIERARTRTTRRRRARSPTSRSSREREHQRLGGLPPLRSARSRSTHQVVSYLKRRVPGGEVIARGAARPARRGRCGPRRCGGPCPTHALAEAGLAAADLPGAAHAAEHCSIGLLPLFATCDRWDIGGVSTALHPDTGRLTVFVYDGHPGGAGFAERGFRPPRGLAGRHPRRDRRLRVRRGLPVVRPVAQVRQPEQPARQAAAPSRCSTRCSPPVPSVTARRRR